MTSPQMKPRAKRWSFITAGVVVTAIMLMLGLWQMSVFEGQGRMSAEQYAAQPPVPLKDQLKGSDSTSAWGRPVSVTGEYLPDLQFYWGTTYPVKIVTGFKTSEGQTIAIVRGLLNYKETAPAPPTGVITQTGVILPGDEKTRNDIPAQDLPKNTVSSLRLPVLAQSWPAPLINGYVSLGAADASAQGLKHSPPNLAGGQGRSRNAGYALQWWVFAAAAMGFSIVLARNVKDEPRT